MIFFSGMFLFLYFQFLCIYGRFLNCGYYEVDIYWPVTISTRFKLIKSFKFKHIPKDLHFFTPLSHVLCFWCHILHLHVYLLIVYCSYNWFYKFCLLIFVLAYLSGLSTAFTTYLPLLVGFFLSYKFLLLVLALSFPLKEDALTFF